MMMGSQTDETWERDPKHILFTLSRYKFVAKMLKHRLRVLEIGCGDGFGTPIVASMVGHVTAIDSDQSLMLDSSNRPASVRKNIEFHHALISEPDIFNPKGEPYDGAYCIDVIEHFSLLEQHELIRGVKVLLKLGRPFIIGTPSYQSQIHASPISKREHKGCRTAWEWEVLLQSMFGNVFTFSMNDEVIHTGFEKMANYLFFLCLGTSDNEVSIKSRENITLDNSAKIWDDACNFRIRKDKPNRRYACLKYQPV